AGAAQAHHRLGMPLPAPPPKNQALGGPPPSASPTGSEIKEAILFPANIQPDLGQLSVVATPTVIGGLEGVFTYMRDYPYACWEQKLTKGGMAAHYRALTAYLDKNFQWPESQDMPERTLALAASYECPNGGSTYYMPTDQDVR